MKKVQIGLMMLLAIFMLTGWTDAFGAGQGKWQGYLVDRHCAESVREDSEPKVFLQHHTKDCALMPNCRARGYSLYANEKWFDFDKAGNQRAVKILQASKRKSGFFVAVIGTAQGKVLKVASIKEIEEPKAE
ncbi:MAG: hypothetical protein K2X27_18070 [Candidatus Obscuribacterales bacterium]|nr:hypothetical protein [Candidatus Obscuribacterales bacterium]